MKFSNIVKLIVALLICQIAGALGAIFTTPAIATWYATLSKPGFNPPNWIFAPVWTALFLIMGCSLYLVWIKTAKGRKNTKKQIAQFEQQKKAAYLAFGIQLLLNVVWSILFFGAKSPFYAFIDILALWAAIFMTMRTFSRISKTAAWLLLPYILWVSFAVILNFSILLLNA